MFSVNKTTHPATAVEHVISCNFFNQSGKSLVVAGANIIRVFQLIPDVDLSRKNYHYSESNPPKMKLECLAQFSLFGNIMSMEAVSLANSSRDALILSFKEAKFSIVEYDPDCHDLRTLSLHYFEEDDMRDGWSSNYDIPIIRVDPESRCAAMLVYGRRLVILPFRVDTMLEESENSFQENDSENTSQVLPSYTIVLKTIDEKIENVIDIQFLHGYYEPTVLILYEPVRTFSGRLAVRKDTCAMITISLNIQQQVHPVIWSLNNLPYDCVRAVAVNKPIGGVLVLAVNSLIYLNQSVPPYGVALNSLAESTTNFPLKMQEDIKLTLDCAQTSFISHDKLVISVKTGELYVLSLQADSMRSVRSFHFEKSAASVLTTCTCVFEDNYLFLGSRLGNSLLLRFSTKEQVPTNVSADEKSTVNEQPSKKKKLDTLGDWMASNVSDIRDVDELEVYGNERLSSVMKITSYVFEVCDSLLNIGPCGNVSMGEPAFLSEEFSNSLDPDVEIVTTSGYGKNGALCILQRSIRPQVVTTFELPGYIDMWTVIGSSSTDEQHAFMILSQEDSTMVLQTGREINELDQSGFSTQGPTIFAGNLGNNKYILQVTQMGVRLLQGSEQVQHIPLDLGSPLIQASSADPHVIILTEDGQLILLTLREIKQGVSRLTVQRPTNFTLKPHITTLCIHRDISGLFSHSIPEAERRFHGIKKEKNLISAMKGDIEDEDELLYGESGPQTDIIAQSAFELLSSQYKGTAWWKKYLHQIKPTYWLFLTRENGHFEIYSIPDFQLSYLVPGIGTGLLVLADSLNAAPVIAQPTQQPLSNNTSGTETDVKEILAVSLGHHGRRPLLLIRLPDEIFIYQAYRYPKGFLKVRFKKVETLLTRSNRCRSRNKDLRLPSSEVSQLRYFSNIASYNGELAVEEKDDKFPLPFQDFFSIVLFSPVSWEVIPNTKTDLEDWEHVTCLNTVSLAYEGTRSGLRGYVCVGTNFNYSEDITSRGRIIIYDIIDVVPEPGQPLTKNKMKVMYAKEQKGPVTAITNTQSGFLVTAVGQKIYIWQLKDNDLAGIAFIDTQIYAHRLLSAKSLILVADVYKSITLLRFQEEFRTLSLVGRGFRPAQVYAADFMVDNSQMGFIISDQEKNIIVYKYQPEQRESLGATLDGSIGYILPIPEKNYRRLLMLQNALVTHVPHTAGLNPKDFRTYKSSRKMLGNFARGILDGELIAMFVMLTNNDRADIAKRIGVKPDDILEDLYEMHIGAHRGGKVVRSHRASQFRGPSRCLIIRPAVSFFVQLSQFLAGCLIFRPAVSIFV
ncbi:hypothetical protein V9T40_011798 [Parthenolecanium corni]|uniref:Cleavage and polyadenylation specificity factor subunit 1 n=1 Tax=Parthenolecanium corni TaxID=536013 RepID=A0AAN9T5Z8_9HEMI